MDDIKLADLIDFLEQDRYSFQAGWLPTHSDLAVDPVGKSVTVNLPKLISRIAIRAFLSEREYLAGRPIDERLVAASTEALVALLDERTAKALSWPVISSLIKPKGEGR